MKLRMISPSFIEVLKSTIDYLKEFLLILVFFHYFICGKKKTTRILIILKAEEVRDSI